MIEMRCDNCDKRLQVEDDLAGSKYPCPHCGDINRVPDLAETEPAAIPLVSPSSDHAVRKSRADRAEQAGYPADSGPEAEVIKVRRCWFRSRPLKFLAAAAVFIGAVVGTGWMVLTPLAVWWWLLIGPGVLISGGLLAWWWAERFTAAVVITTKRTTMHNGFFRKSTSEVVHDSIRNVQVDQTFWQRVWRVGKLGISSSGQDGVEIQVNHLPNPNRLREIIDLYRPL